jgi:hypothetical protein
MGTMKRTALPASTATIKRPHSLIVVVLSLLLWFYLAFKSHSLLIGGVGLIACLIGFAFVGRNTDSLTSKIERGNVVLFALIFLWMVAQ